MGSPVVATHPNNTGFTYALSGAASEGFTVDEGTGQIRVGESAELEEGDSYIVTLGATLSLDEHSSLTVHIAVSIGVTAPEPPAIRYDFNGNEIIEKDEVLAAAVDYFAGLIGKDDILALVASYFAA